MATAEFEIVERITAPEQSPEREELADFMRTRRALRAIEAYKAVCAAEGTEPSQEECWLLLIAAVNSPE